jgi:predicted O-linked N-acetylglucosamine transferase (SPINDLY family)
MAAPNTRVQAASTRAQRRQDIAGTFANAMMCHQQGLLAEAQKGYHLILKKRANHFDALHMLGLSEHQLGNPEAAMRWIKRALLVDPSSALAHSNLGAILLSLRSAEASLASCDSAIRLAPGFADAHFNRGNALFALGRFAEATASFRTAVAFRPQYIDALNNCGNALHRAGQFADAIACYDEVFALDPGHVLARINKGAALIELRKMDEAIADLDRAIALAPGHVGAWLNRGEALLLRSRLPEALDSYDGALKLDARSPEAWLGRANVLMLSKRLSEAKRACHEALAIEPDLVKALVQLGQCHALQGEAEVAIAFFDRAVHLDPRGEAAHANRIFTLDFSATADFAAHQAARAAWWQVIGAPEARQRPALVHDNERDPDRKLVVGYVSGEFKRRSAAYCFRPILASHDKARFEVVCYSTSPTSDDVTETFTQVADRWREVSQWPDDQLIDRIRQDKIDILVDLSGHSAENRLRVFARKPAPIQVTAWGHASGTGIPTIDYLFSDPIAIPYDVRDLYAERVYDLPCLIIVEPPPGGLRKSVPPVVQNGFLTYGVFNRISKLSDAAVALWSQLLVRDSDCRLVIKDHLLNDTETCHLLLDRFARSGADVGRISLLGSTSRDAHLAAFSQVDVCLDPFPHGGGVSTWEALHMGVPVVAKLGQGVANRMSGATLSAIGLADWVAKDDGEYLEIAARPTKEGLQALRQDLPALIDRHCGPRSYAKAVEDAYRDMWRRYCGAGV